MGVFIKPKMEYDSTFSMLYDVLLNQGNLSNSITNLENIVNINLNNEGCNCDNNAELLIQNLQDIKDIIQNNQPIIQERVEKVYIDKPVVVEKPVYVEKPIVIEKTVEVVKEVEKPVIKEVIKKVYVDRYIRDNGNNNNGHHNNNTNDNNTGQTINHNTNNGTTYKPTTSNDEKKKLERPNVPMEIIIAIKNKCGGTDYVKCQHPQWTAYYTALKEYQKKNNFAKRVV